MKAELYQWMKNLAVFYILFTALLHLVPDKKYEKYVRLFMGLLLIFMMCTPVFSILGKGEELAGSFQLHFEDEEQLLEKKEAEDLQILYLQKGYEEELKEKIAAAAEIAGIKLIDTAVHIEGERVSAVLYVREEPKAEQERRIADVLRENWGIGEGELTLSISLYGKNAVDCAAASGTAAGSGCDACVS